MNVWAEIALAVIAVATMLMAAIQIAVIVYAARLARRVDRLAEQVEQEIKPVLLNLNVISDNAARAAALAVAQVERADRLFADFSRRVDQTLTLIQTAVVAPAREGLAVFAAVRAALGALRDLRGGSRYRRAGVEDEHALFIG